MNFVKVLQDLYKNLSGDGSLLETKVRHGTSFPLNMHFGPPGKYLPFPTFTPGISISPIVSITGLME